MRRLALEWPVLPYLRLCHVLVLVRGSGAEVRVQVSNGVGHHRLQLLLLASPGQPKVAPRHGVAQVRAKARVCEHEGVPVVGLSLLAEPRGDDDGAGVKPRGEDGQA
eukprot:2119292-Pleurochrysis_carterae.AAC.1